MKRPIKHITYPQTWQKRAPMRLILNLMRRTRYRLPTHGARSTLVLNR